jgi:hypothetical protein
MNIARVVSGLGIVLSFSAGACATRHGEEGAAPVASPSNAGVSSTPSTLDEAPGEPPPPAAAPPSPSLAQPKSAEAGGFEDFTTLEAAERALNQAKADLERLAIAEPMPTVGRSAADGAEKKKADSKRGAPSAAGAAAPTTSAPSAQCDNACRAFASLTRAASAVCRLDGDNGTHCSHAKRVVSDSERRVASCTCPAPGQ